MKNLRRTIFLFIMGFCAVMARAVPANPVPVNVSQPDGEMLTIVLHGDEFYHFTTTCDGFTLVKNNGGWEYAVKQAGSLAPSGVLAHNPSHRTAREVQLVKSLETNMIDDQDVGLGRRARSNRDHKSVSREPVVDYGSFRGLVVLVEFNDKPFGMSNPQSFYNDMVNTRNYTGFQWKNQSGQSVFQSCTGSARDYYYDQSMGHFDPQFDVVGPVKVPFSCHDARNKSTSIFLKALEMIDSSVNFAKYDSDHNGEIDIVFFQVSGYTSNYGGNDEDYLWPHMSFLYDYDDDIGYYIPRFDGLDIGRYACSGEIYGWESEGSTLPNGVGTICHEFTHVLGLPDLYDADYSGSGGQSNDPANWDVMAIGCYANYGRTPVGYSLWERAELGWATPVALTEGSRTLNPIHSANTGYVLEASGEETFFFENRQQIKWDASLPGHGLLVARVDHSNPEVWEANMVNANPVHNYYELVRAGSNEADATFPGTTGKTQLNATSNPRLSTWAGIVCDLGLENIAENNGVISFTVAQGPAASQMVEDFETMPLSPDNMQTGVQGQFSKWDFVQADVAAVEQFESPKSCVMGMPASITMTGNVYADIYTLTVEAMNPSTTDAKLQLSYSIDEGATWTSLGVQTVAGGDKTKLIWRVDLMQPVRFRLNRTAGSKTQPLYVDNFTINYTGRDKSLFKHNGLWYRDSDVGSDVSDVTLVAPQQGENYTGKVIILDAFSHNGQTKVVRQIDANAFTGTAVTSVEVPSSVTSIGKEAFYEAKSLESLVLATDKAPRKFALVGDDFAGENASNFNCYVANNNLASWLENYYQISFLPWVKTGSDGYLTFACVRRVALPDGLTAYRVTGFNASQRMATTTMMTDNRIPAKNGVILKGKPETRYLMQTTIQAPAIGDNMLLPLLTIDDIPYAPFAAQPDDSKAYFLASSGKWHQFANNIDLFMALYTGVAYLAVPKTLLGGDYTTDVRLDLWASGTRGDLNGDGMVDVTDVSIIIDIVLGKNNPDLLSTAQPDLDSNGMVDVTDVSLLIDIVLGK